MSFIVRFHTCIQLASIMFLSPSPSLTLAHIPIDPLSPGTWSDSTNVSLYGHSPPSK